MIFVIGITLPVCTIYQHLKKSHTTQKMGLQLQLRKIIFLNTE